MTVAIVVVATIVLVVLLLVALVALVASTVAPFRVQQLLELATVEEDPSALLALVDQDAVALVGAHLATTFRASQDRCVSHLVLLVSRWPARVGLAAIASDADADPPARHP